MDRRPGQPPTVVHVLQILNPGGIEHRLLDTARALRGDPVRLVVCTLSGKPGRLAAQFEEAGVEIIPVRLADARFPIRFVRLLKRLDATVVHSHVHFMSGLILALAWLARTPIRIAHFRSDDHGHSAPSRLRVARYGVMKKWVDTFATNILGVSPSTLELNWSPEWARDARCEVLPNGIDLDRFHSDCADRGSVRNELGLPAESLVVAHVGRADILSKNRELALQIAAESLSAGSPFELVFVGRDGVDAEQSQVNRTRWAGLTDPHVAAHVHYLGERSDVPHVVAAADVMLLTSTREGLPGVVLEALAVGTPVVSSDVPGAVYIANALAGVAVVPLSSPVTSWCEAIATTASSGRVTSALEGTPFDMRVCVQRYRELWRIPS